MRQPHVEAPYVVSYHREAKAGEGLSHEITGSLSVQYDR